METLRDSRVMVCERETMASVSIGSLSLRKGGIASVGGTKTGSALIVPAIRVKIREVKNDLMEIVMA
jgi:hypothetical protein